MNPKPYEQSVRSKIKTSITSVCHCYIYNLIHSLKSPNPPCVPPSYYAGTFELPVSSLRDPPSELRVREVKKWYVDHLVNILTKDDLEDMTAPFLVIASIGPSEFRPSSLSSYTYTVSCKLSVLSRLDWHCFSGYWRYSTIQCDYQNQWKWCTNYFEEMHGVWLWLGPNKCFDVSSSAQWVQPDAKNNIIWGNCSKLQTAPLHQVCINNCARWHPSPNAKYSSLQFPVVSWI